MSSSLHGGTHQDERGKTCVDGDLTTKCVSACVSSCEESEPDRFPWIALNLGGFQQETEQFVDVSRVEVTIREKTNLNFAVSVSKLSPGRLSRCFKEGTDTCNSVSLGLTPDIYSISQIESWLGGPETILMGKENGPFDDEQTFSISQENDSGGIICWELMFS